MKKYIFLTSLLFSFVIVIFLQMNCARNEETKVMSQEEMVARGKYLVTFGGCNDCHTPKMMTEMGPMEDTTKVLSGAREGQTLSPIDTSDTNVGKWIYTNADITSWVGPWGLSFAANLTPDGPTGLGNWTEEIFIKALREGKHMGSGRPILPPMPWFNYAKATDEDLKAIFAYLKSLPPIKNKVSDPIPPNMIAQKLAVKK